MLQSQIFFEVLRDIIMMFTLTTILQKKKSKGKLLEKSVIIQIDRGLTDLGC